MPKYYENIEKPLVFIQYPQFSPVRPFADLGPGAAVPKYYEISAIFTRPPLCRSGPFWALGAAVPKYYENIEKPLVFIQYPQFSPVRPFADLGPGAAVPVRPFADLGHSKPWVRQCQNITKILKNHWFLYNIRNFHPSAPSPIWAILGPGCGNAKILRKY